MVVLMLVAGSLYLSYVFSYLYLWTVSPDVWPAHGAPALPGLHRPALSAVLCLVAVLGFAAADRWLPPAGTRAILPATLGVLIGCAALAVAVAVEIVSHWQSGVRPEATAYGAMVYLAGLLAAQVVAALVLMGLSPLPAWWRVARIARDATASTTRRCWPITRPRKPCSASPSSTASRG
jgi:cytochrome c oxidase subunit I+III